MVVPEVCDVIDVLVSPSSVVTESPVAQIEILWTGSPFLSPKNVLAVQLRRKR